MNSPTKFYVRRDGTPVYGVITYLDENSLAALERARATMGMRRAEFLRMAINLLVMDVEHDAEKIER